MFEGLKNLTLLESLVVCIPFILLSIVVVILMIYKNYLYNNLMRQIKLNKWYDLLKSTEEIPNDEREVVVKYRLYTGQPSKYDAEYTIGYYDNTQKKWVLNAPSWNADKNGNMYAYTVLAWKEL